jgi:hypothetical protein
MLFSCVPFRQGGGVNIVNMRNAAWFFLQFVWKPNAGHQARLEAVACMPSLGLASRDRTWDS